MTFIQIRSLPERAKELMVESDKSINMMGMEGIDVKSEKSYVSLAASNEVSVESKVSFTKRTCISFYM